jgi:phage terminase large subunit-like protein
LLQEAQARGIELPPEAKNALADKKKATWPIASNGYFLRDDGKLYDPSPVHSGFINSKARYVLLYGPRGCGKSGGGGQKALFKIMAGEDGIISNPDFENLKVATWPEFKRWIPWNMVIPSQRHRQSNAWQPTQPFMMAFLNGVKVYIKGGKDSSSSRGPNVNWFWYDEGGRDETGLSWQITNAGVRIGKDPQAWCTMTPKPMEHWAYQFFILQNVSEEAKLGFEKVTKGDRILIEYFHATRADNAKNLSPGFYEEQSINYPSGWLRAQEYDGDFANEGGKIGDRNWFNNKILDVAPEAKRKVRFWDLGATEKKTAKDDPDEAVGTLVSKFMKDKEDSYCIEHQIGGCWAWDNLLVAIANTARADGPFIPIVLEEEPGSGGINQVAAISSYLKKFPELASHTVIGQRARDVGDRVMAANHWFGLAASGKMYLVKGEWNGKFLSQLDGFTQISHDDRITSVSGGMTYIRPFRQWKKMPFLSV